MAAVSVREIAATRDAQTFIGMRSSNRLVPDGWWGSYTQAAYDALGPMDKAVVDAILNAHGMSAVRLRQAYVAANATDPSSKTASREERQRQLATQGDMVELVRRVATREQVPLQTALKICWLESKFIPTARSPTGAKGLFQMTTIAVQDVRERAGFDLTGREYDPEANAIAGMRYIKLVARDLRVPLTDTVNVYMGFNIGPTAARLYQKGILNDVVVTAINRQAYGKPPEYGRRLALAVQNAHVA